MFSTVMNTTLTCSNCIGTGIEHNCRVEGVSAVSNPDTMDKFSTVDYDSVRECYSCKGHGVQTKNGRAYKSAGMCEKGRTNKTARRCHLCQGDGQTINTTVPASCYSCSGNGQVPQYLPGTVFPANQTWESRKNGDPAPDYMTWSTCDNLDKAVQTDFANNVVIKVRSGEMTTAQGLLGLGCLWSCTDYGTALEELVDTTHSLTDNVSKFTDKIRQELKTNRTQWTKILHPTTNVISGVIVVTVGRNGYAIQAAF